MSFKVKEKKELKIAPIEGYNNKEYLDVLSQIVWSFSSFFTIKQAKDIYSGDEDIPFDRRHPTYKSLMKLEFQDIMRQFERK